MSYNLSTPTVWVDKRDHAHYTSMTWVPSACRESRVSHSRKGFCPQEAEVGDSPSRVVLSHAMAVQAHTWGFSPSYQPLQGGVSASLIGPWLPV